MKEKDLEFVKGYKHVNRKKRIVCSVAYLSHYIAEDWELLSNEEAKLLKQQWEAEDMQEENTHE